MLKSFRALKESSDFRRHKLPFLQTLEDEDLVREIGFNQAMGHPLSLKQLFMHGISSVATVQRRVSRLKRLGIVAAHKTDHDKRVLRLILTPHAQKLFTQWGKQLRRSLK